MRAYKPTGEALFAIVNHVNPEVRRKAEEEARNAGFSSTPSPINIGTVRYASTARMHRGAGTPLVKVLIEPSDFLARRTAVLGMTRTGKSNTAKASVSAVGLATLRDGITIGQLIFDVNGEYANANHQDDASSIADVFNNTICCQYTSMNNNKVNDLLKFAVVMVLCLAFEITSAQSCKDIPRYDSFSPSGEYFNVNLFANGTLTIHYLTTTTVPFSVFTGSPSS